MSDKPIREYDRFIVRLPDGMRDRLQQRAVASGRSMNAEVLAMLEQGLDGGGVQRGEDLAAEALRLNRNMTMLTVSFQEAFDRQKAVQAEIRGFLKGNPDHPLADQLRLLATERSRKSPEERAEARSPSSAAAKVSKSRTFKLKKPRKRDPGGQ